MTLPEFWFVLIAFMFVSYFVLEGFDFGVGALLPVLGGDDIGRRVMINTIAPVWDANETWLVLAAGAMVAAFPHWYGSAFSAFYLPLLAILACLIARGVAFEFRGKVDDPNWRNRADIAIAVGSWAPAVLWGVAFASIVRGLPVDAHHQIQQHAFPGGFERVPADRVAQLLTVQRQLFRIHLGIEDQEAAVAVTAGHGTRAELADDELGHVLQQFFRHIKVQIVPRIVAVHEQNAFSALNCQGSLINGARIRRGKHIAAGGHQCRAIERRRCVGGATRAS